MDFSALKDFMDRLTSWIIPGNSISVYYKNEEVFRYSSGFADLETKKPMSEEMFMNIYSCSKVSTVVGALQLLEKGRFLLSDPLYEYIPQYKEMYIKNPDGKLVKAKNPITIQNLFTMTAGLTYDRKTAGFEKAERLTDGKFNTVTVAECIAEDPLVFEPGTHWNYSLCHDVLSALVEIVSGKRFSEYMKENVFDPCGIKAVYHRTPEIEKNMVSQYQYRLTKNVDAVSAQRGDTKGMLGVVVKVGLDNLAFGSENDSGGGGLVTTVEDYAKLTNALANFGVAKTGERILSKGTVELLRTNQLNEIQLKDLNWSQLKGYGYGLGVRTLISKAKSGSVGPVGEFGWGGAAGATVLVDPDNEFSLFYAHHMLNPQEEYYQPRLRNVAYMCLNK